MKLAKTLVLGLALGAALSTPARAAVREEHVTGGVLDLVWNPGLGLSNRLQPLTLAPGDAGYANPSGDHTVGLARSSMAPDSGGAILTCTEPAGLSDYSWEGWIFTGDGNSRRGLVVRADPTNEFNSCYQFVIQSGLFQINFRKLVNGTPTTLGTWFANTLPNGVPQVNTWHRMKVLAIGGNFRCWFDDFEQWGRDDLGGQCFVRGNEHTAQPRWLTWRDDSPTGAGRNRENLALRLRRRAGDPRAGHAHEAEAR